MNRDCCCKATLKLNTTPQQPIKVDCDAGSPFLNMNSKDTGPMGPVGPQGNGIERIEKTATSGLVDTYTIYYTDGSETTFEVNNGEKGETGPAGKDATINGVNTLTLQSTNGITQSQSGTTLILSGKTLQDAITAETNRAELVEGELNTAISGKQTQLTQAQLNAVNSGINTTKVSAYDNHIANTTIHVTAQEKINWNNKQNAIQDLDTIRSNALAGKNASDTISGYGNIVTHDVSEFATSAQGNLADTALQPTDVIDNTSSNDTDKPLSANMGKSLQDQVDNLKARGRFLALWNCATGLAESDPPSGTYTYQAGDYFIVGVVAQSGGTNYKPDGATYTTGVASTVVETQPVDTDDVYYYDGHVWRLQVNTQKEIGFVNIAGDPYDNTALASALNAKQNTISDLSDIRAGASAGATALQPSALNGYATQTWVGQQGFLTSTALTGYATQQWVQNQGYLTSINSSDVINALGYIPYNASNPDGYITSSAISNMQTTTNLVTSLSSLSTDTQYPSAKCVWDIIGDIESTINAIRGV